jgi:hypothetical protein
MSLSAAQLLVNVHVGNGPDLSDLREIYSDSAVAD